MKDKKEQIYLRGFDNDHGTDLDISVDGIPVNMVSHAHGQGYADLHFLIPETIEKVDFNKGPYYAKYIYYPRSQVVLGNAHMVSNIFTFLIIDMRK